MSGLFLNRSAVTGIAGRQITRIPKDFSDDSVWKVDAPDRRLARLPSAPRPSRSLVRGCASQSSLISTGHAAADGTRGPVDRHRKTGCEGMTILRGDEGARTCPGAP